MKLNDYIEDPSNVFTEEEVEILYELAEYESKDEDSIKLIRELEIENFQLKEQLRKSDADNFHLKRQLLNKNDEIRSQRKIIDKLSKRLNSKQTPRYRNQRGDRR